MSFTEASLANRTWAPLLGRLLIAAMFVPAGLDKITGFSGTVGYIQSATGLPLPQVAAAAAIAVEVGAGVLLALGLHTRFAAAALAVFTLAASLLFHNFWAMPAEQQGLQAMIFWKNLAVVGGLLAIMGLGGGRWSLDARRTGIS